MAGAPSDLADLLQTAFRYALALTHDEALADDVLQEACLGLLSAGADWNERYLLTAVRTRFVDHCRGTRRAAEAAEAHRLRIAEVAPVDPVGVQDCRARLHAALGRLRPEEREVLFLHAAAGCSAGRIGALTDRPRSTVLSLLQRSRRKLSRMLRPDAAEVCHG